MLRRLLLVGVATGLLAGISVSDAEANGDVQREGIDESGLVKEGKGNKEKFKCNTKTCKIWREILPWGD